MQKYGIFHWECKHCGRVFNKDTPQGLAMAKENHMRVHRPKIHPHPYEDLGGCCGDA